MKVYALPTRVTNGGNFPGKASHFRTPFHFIPCMVHGLSYIEIGPYREILVITKWRTRISIFRFGFEWIEIFRFSFEWIEIFRFGFVLRLGLVARLLILLGSTV